MKAHHRILAAALVFGGLTSAAFADPKHDKKTHAKHDKHAVQHTVLFHEMDDNHDGVISRHEWRGSRESFGRHDWNHNGILSGAELRRGSAPVSRYCGSWRDEDRGRRRFGRSGTRSCSLGAT